MRETIKQSKPEWIIEVKVVDRQSKKQGKKAVVYRFDGEVRSESLGQTLGYAVAGMQNSGSQWKELKRWKEELKQGESK